jgi:transcriptional regulator with XRE-family HTH domain
MARQTARANQPISNQLRAFIEANSGSAYELAHEAGIQRASLSRFLSGERTLSQEYIDRLCAALQLRLVASGRRSKR